MEHNFVNVEFSSYLEIIEYFNINKNFPGFIFRGHQRNEWSLKSSFFRINDIDKKPHRILMDRHLHKFKIFIRGRIDSKKNYIDDEIWSIGQHYGLATPLLDWTASEYIALFFSARNNNLDQQKHSVYCLNTKEINRYLVRRITNKISDYSLLETFEKRYDSLEKYSMDEKKIIIGQVIIELMESNSELGKYKDVVEEIIEDCIILVNPRIDNNPRLLSQRGLFTRNLKTKSIDEIVKQNDWNTDQIVLYKITYNDSLCTEITDNLNSMNINELSLFPDLDGTSKYCNYKLEREANNSEDEIIKINLTNPWV
jgi:hypothetical protein